MAEAYVETLLPVHGPYDFARTVRAFTWGRDPSIRFHRGVLWLAERWPTGPATLRVAHTADGVHAAAWGPGRDTALAQAPRVAGLHDDASTFDPRHRWVREAWARHPGIRIPATGRLVTSTFKTILGQLVTTREAVEGWEALCRLFREDAPGPGRLLLPPDAADLARTAPWRVVALGILRKQAETIRRVAEVAPRLREAADLPMGPAMKRLMAVPGVGPWTAGSVVATALGAADAVILGDLHLPGQVGFALAGEPEADDARMLQLLEPFRGHRYRVVRLVHMVGPRAPRRGPLPDPRAPRR
jgi:3-methyladenine DNA glycosylase/8-oxoguanine DNA glycosylase